MNAIDVHDNEERQLLWHQEIDDKIEWESDPKDNANLYKNVKY